MRRRPARFWSAAITLALSGCGAAGAGGPTASEHAPSELVEHHAPPTGTLWVIAPHPDDEVLMAGQALLDAVAEGRAHEVVIVTNGDFTCSRDGWARQRESIAALASIGVTEAHVHFLGYPDGWLAELSETPLPPIPRTAPDGTCGTGTGTYGARGAEQGDVHRARTGAAGDYTAGSLVGDLVALFEASPPSQIHLPHAIDTHPDHAMTYAYVRRALDAASLPSLPVLVRHVVHAPGAACWPAVAPEGSPCVAPSPTLDATPMPPLPAPLDRYAPDRVDPADAAARRAAIGHYVTQLDGPLESSWLASFARTTEPAWLQRLERTGGGVRAMPAGAAERREHTMSLDRDGDGSMARLGELLVERRRRTDAALDELVVSVSSGASGTTRLNGMVVPAREGPLPIQLSVIHLPDGDGAEIELFGPDGMLLGAVLVGPGAIGTSEDPGRGVR